jgi:hypothetical protein
MHKMQISKTLYENQCQTFSSHNKNNTVVELVCHYAPYMQSQVRQISLTHMPSAVKSTP